MSIIKIICKEPFEIHDNIVIGDATASIYLYFRPRWWQFRRRLQLSRLVIRDNFIS